MIKETEVRKSFLEQAEICASLGSEFMECFCLGLGNHLDKSTQTGRRILEWDGNPYPKGDALALRLAGGIHAIVRRGSQSELAQYYADTKRVGEPDFVKALLALIREKDDELITWLDNAPQTNEVARSSAIFAGLSAISQKFQMPLSLLELGASGGLNLQCASFGYEFSGQIFGDTSSDLQLKPEWQGMLFPNVDVHIQGRRGCDLNPLSVNDEEDCEKLIAYLWPDQPARIKRVETAIEIAKKSPPVLDKTDAADWVESIFKTSQSNGAVRVLYHTIAQNYFPQSVIDRIKNAVEVAGQAATIDTPIAWLSFEFEGDGNPKLRLRTWPDNEDTILATADPHVYGIEWI